MILKLIGVIWIISGSTFLWKPHWLKKRLRRKGLKYVRKLMIATYLFAVGSIFSLAVDIGGLMAYILASVLTVALLAYLFKLYKRMSNHAAETFENVDNRIIHRVAWAYLAAGIALILGSSWDVFR